MSMIPHIWGKNIFVTGGAGFIGSSLIGRLYDGNVITAYDNFRRDALSAKPYAHKVNRVEGDVLDRTHLFDAMTSAQPDIVVHCAAIAGIDTVIQKPTETMRVNMLGTANALEAAHQVGGIERFVDFSTSEVFGPEAFRAEENHYQ